MRDSWIDDVLSAASRICYEDVTEMDPMLFHAAAMVVWWDSEPLPEPVSRQGSTRSGVIEHAR